MGTRTKVTSSSVPFRMAKEQKNGMFVERKQRTNEVVVRRSISVYSAKGARVIAHVEIRGGIRRRYAPPSADDETRGAYPVERFSRDLSRPARFAVRCR